MMLWSVSSSDFSKIGSSKLEMLGRINIQAILPNEIKSSRLESYQRISVNTSWLYSKKLRQRQEQMRKNPPDTHEIMPMGWNTWSSRKFSLDIVSDKNPN